MKKIIYLTLCLIFLTSCFLINSPYDEIKTLKAIEKLDGKYGTNWRTESLPEKAINSNVIDSLISDVRALQEQTQNNYVDKKIGLSDMKHVLYNITEARIAMLESQKKYWEAEALGPDSHVLFINKGMKGEVVKGINCSSIEKMNLFNELYNSSVKRGQNFIYFLDDAMSQSETARNYIGTGVDKKPRFYKSAFGDMLLQVEVNNAVAAQCSGRKLYKEE